MENEFMKDKVKLKICGITRENEIPIINKVKPDYIGFVFAQSKRRIDDIQAARLKSMLVPEIQTVGVFVDEASERIISLLDRGIIDIAQLHGNEDEETIAYIKNETGKPVIKAVIVGDSIDESGESGEFTGYSTIVERWRGTSADYLLLDSGKGSGKNFDWSRLDWDRIKETVGNIFLAGGVNPENVADAVSKVQPYCIDVSSGVELDGMKNEELIYRLIRNMNYYKYLRMNIYN